MTTQTADPRFDVIEQHPDDAETAYAYFPPTEESMRALAQELFGTYWRSVVVGPCIEGAVCEIAFQSPPEIRYSDGYLTIDLGPWHFHLCVGAHKGSNSEELRRNRPVAKIAFFERRGKGCAGGRSWGLRLWNGHGEQMTTVFSAESAHQRRSSIAEDAGLVAPRGVLSPAVAVPRRADAGRLRGNRAASVSCARVT